MRFPVGAAAVNAGAVQHDIDAQFTPGQVGDIALVKESDSVFTNKQLLALLAHIPRETPVAGVIFQ